MRYMRTTLLGAAALALAAGAACAQPASQGMVLYDAAGTPVAVLTPLTGATPANDPAIQLLRQMEATMAAPFGAGLQRLIAAQEASMQAMEQTMEAAFQAPGQTGADTWSIASGQGHCAETVTFTYSADGQQFVQRKTGKVCGKQDYGKTGSMPATVTPPPSPDRPRLLEVSSPPQAPLPLHG